MVRLHWNGIYLLNVQAFQYFIRIHFSYYTYIQYDPHTRQKWKWAFREKDMNSHHSKYLSIIETQL